MKDTEIKDKIYTHQAIFLITVYRMMIALTYSPIIKTRYSNQDTWIIILLSIPYTIVFCLPLLYLTNKFNNLNLLEYSEKIMGKFAGKILSIIYATVFLFYLIFFTSTFIEILDSALYPNTPTWVNMLILIFTCVYIVSKGSINIVRLAEFVVPLIMIVFLLLLILGFENYDFEIFLPILKDSTFKQLNIGAIYSSTLYIDILILTMISPNLQKKKDLNKIFIQSLLYSSVVALLSTVAIQATLGVEYSKHVNFPFYSFARLIKIGATQGFDLLYVVTWMVGSILRLSGYFYTTTVAFVKVFNIRNQKTFIPLAIILMTSILLIKDRRTVIAAGNDFRIVITAVTTTAVTVVPLILLLIYFFRRKKLKNTTGSNKQ